jgi:hypothetical protein
VKHFLTYTFARFGLLALTFGIGYLAGLRGMWLYILAFLGSGIISLVVLDNQRTLMGGALGKYFSGINAKIDANTRKEDID